MHKKFLLLIFNFSCLIFNSTFSQPAIQWQKCLGGTNHDYGTCQDVTSDGGCIVAGYALSNNGDITGNHGGQDIWVAKLDSTGNIQWQKCLGGSGVDRPYSIRHTSDGGYIVAGYTVSFDGDITFNHGTDYWVVKLTSTGAIQWQKCLGGSAEDIAYSVVQISGGGYMVAGFTSSNDGDVTGNHGNQDYWIVKLDASGAVVWQKCFGGAYSDVAYSIQETTDGGFIIGGSSFSNNGNVSGNHGYADYWLVRIDGSGNILWQKSLGGTLTDVAYSVQQTFDGGYVAAGRTLSSDGDVHCNNPTSNFWIVKIDDDASIQWDVCIGGFYDDSARSICQTPDGGFVVTGASYSNDGHAIGHHGTTAYSDYLAAKINSAGTVVWSKCLGGANDDIAYAIQPSMDGGYFITGSTLSTDGDVTSNHGNHDYWVVKLATDITGMNENVSDSYFNIWPNPFSTHATIKFPNEINQGMLRLYDMYGEVILERNNIMGKEIIINAENLSSGVYAAVVLEKGKKIYSGKAMVY